MYGMHTVSLGDSTVRCTDLSSLAEIQNGVWTVRSSFDRGYRALWTGSL
jgi:hypothetical protein